MRGRGRRKKKWKKERRSLLRRSEQRQQCSCNDNGCRWMKHPPPHLFRLTLPHRLYRYSTRVQTITRHGALLSGDRYMFMPSLVRTMGQVKSIPPWCVIIVAHNTPFSLQHNIRCLAFVSAVYGSIPQGQYVNQMLFFHLSRTEPFFREPSSLTEQWPTPAPWCWLESGTWEPRSRDACAGIKLKRLNERKSHQTAGRGGCQKVR